MALRLIGLLVLAISGIITLSACNSSQSSAAGSGFILSQGGRIAYSDAAGKTAFLTTGPGDLSGAASPDGNLIAFTRIGSGEATGTYIVKADGTGEKKVAQYASTQNPPAWSPDGKRIAFRDTTEQGQGLWTVNADGSNLQHAFDGDCATPSWSPDGKSIAVASAQKLAPKGTELGIYIIDSQSLDKKLIAPGMFGALAYSPDGKSLAVVSAAKTGFPTDLVVVDVASGQSTAVAGNVSDGVWSPAWSPDGKSVALVIIDKEEQVLVRTNIAGTESKVLAKGASLGTPVWSTDGKSLVVGVRATGAKTYKAMLVSQDGAQPAKEVAAGNAPGFIAKAVNVANPITAKPKLDGVNVAELKLAKGSWG